MTAGHDDPFAAPVDDDTEGCLCLVAGYARKDGLIARVTDEAARRVIMSPALGDFLQLRYVDLGPQPGAAGDRSRPVRQIVADLMAAPEMAGRTHFALVVIAKSAATIEGLVGSCAADPFLAGLRMRFAGIASYDDRERTNGLADITSSATGSWRDERELVDALRQRCDELPRFFATRGATGLTRGELVTLRQDHAAPVAGGDGQPGPGEPSDTSEPDVLAAPETAGPAAADGGPTASGGRRLAASAARWVPDLRRRRPRPPAEAAGAQDAASTDPARAATGLVYLLMVIDQDSAVDSAVGRLQAALLDVDQVLAADPFCQYQVRAIHGTDGDLSGELQDAGQLARRAAKRSVKAGDFAEVLKSVRGSLRRDGRIVSTIATAAGQAVAAPAVVIFTADPPVADVGAAAVFGDMAAEAKVIWVVPGKLEGLVSPAFGGAAGATVLGEHQAVADEILEVMQAGVLAS